MSELDRSSKTWADTWLSVSEGKSDNADEVGIIYINPEQSEIQDRAYDCYYKVTIYKGKCESL